jgi:2-dehydro-3-deoxygalactonokinase
MTVDCAMIALDWGSSNVRAFALDANGKIVATNHSSAGAMTLGSDAAAFDAALVALIGPWSIANPKALLIACGMVGAKSGWREARYVGVGSSVKQIAANTINVDTSLGKSLAIVPGIKGDDADVDVMRGEETQIAGSGVSDGWVVLPGTHSKWARVEGGSVTQFATYFTGEMNTLIRVHSAVGKAIPDAPNLENTDAFQRGIERAKARCDQWLHDLFVFRAAVVTGARSAADVSTEFSAWLLGCEFAAALRSHPQWKCIHVIASESLMPWYQATANAFSVDCISLDGEACAARGLWLIGNA